MIFVTVLSTINYLPGVIQLKNNLKTYNKKLFLVVPTNLKSKSFLFRKLDLDVIYIDNLEMPSDVLDKFLDTSKIHWKSTFFKLKLFSIESFANDKVIYIDSDIYIRNGLYDIENKPELSFVFDSDFMINSKISGINSGVFTFKYDINFYNLLLKSIFDVSKFKSEFGDQDVISYVLSQNNFSDVNKLPILFNANFFLVDKYEKQKISFIHFIGPKKPWEWSTIEFLLRCCYYLSSFRLKTFYYTAIYYKKTKKIKNNLRKIIKEC